jgi:hypothetical protein
MFEKLKLKIKDLLKEQLVKLDEKVAKSPNKVDDMIWAQIRVMIIAWIEEL